MRCCRYTNEHFVHRRVCKNPDEEISRTNQCSLIEFYTTSFPDVDAYEAWAERHDCEDEPKDP